MQGEVLRFTLALLFLFKLFRPIFIVFRCILELSINSVKIIELELELAKLKMKNLNSVCRFLWNSIKNASDFTALVTNKRSRSRLIS